jgi:hypothetical protein
VHFTPTQLEYGSIRLELDRRQGDLQHPWLWRHTRLPRWTVDALGAPHVGKRENVGAFNLGGVNLGY